ncbi:MAG: type II secretion system F family protein [Butyrivibrio sp.]|nr:type II secretion system F family protein [Butyrivibrio sp.]
MNAQPNYPQQAAASRKSLIQRCRSALREKQFSIRDIPILLRGALLPVLFGRLFYGSWIAVALLSPMVIPWFVHQQGLAHRQACRELGIQFRDAIMSVSTAQKAGYSIENAFIEAERDMRLLYGAASPICKELRRIQAGLGNNIPLEQLLEELGVRSGNRDIADFAAVFAVAKRSGGQMTQTIERTIEVIGQRMEVEKEIDVMVSGKRMEAKVMEIVPFGIMLYVGAANPGFFAPLYGSLFGIVAMTGCMVVYVVACLMAERIVSIEV